MIMFLITATTCVGVVGSVYLAVLNIMNSQHRLCSEKILPRSAGTGVEHWVKVQALKVPLLIAEFLAYRQNLLINKAPVVENLLVSTDSEQDCT